ncbi:hypothetical protein [Lacipirellula limnantheis]|uniref:Uncharacterized protein n=1 Tax=Lacipirellula limnantheis TaxID=2528024 RepID=A0A517U521_9BACT|nr:hypothetical protein [Lacipirellula limnantheis]QDT75734.1 hypothetical protein I41_49760 [Lacipirellula limnantheis]
MKRELVVRMQEPMKGDYFGVWWTNGRVRRIFFPLWYPALVFALAGVGVLRFRRQFSIRSALICVSIVAVLLAMAVTL